MKRRKTLVLFMALMGIFLLSFFIFPQTKTTPQKKTTSQPGQKTQMVKNEKESDLKSWLPIIFGGIGLFFGGVGVFFGVYQYLRHKKYVKEQTHARHEAEKEIKDKEKELTDKTAKGRYCATLRNRLGTIELLGSPDVESEAVKLEEAFVSLSISESCRCEERFDPDMQMKHHESGRHLSPEEVMNRAFRKYKLLVIIGEPGSGKTTLLKYYALNCLNKDAEKYRALGFSTEILPIYFPLRELEFDDNDEPILFPDNLARWAERYLLNISGQEFFRWLQDDKTLVLLDGLDEISSKQRRKKVCRWIENMCVSLENARFVMTSRATGYRKLDGIELGEAHLRADIMDFSPEQQQAVLLA